MRILHVVPSYIPAYRYGGPIYSVHGLCKALALHGHDVRVFTTNVDGPCDSDVPLEIPVDIDGVKVWYFPSDRLRRLYWSPPMQKALSQEIRKCDLLHLHSVFLWPTWIAARMARKAKKPYIISPRGMLVKDLMKRKSFIAKTAWTYFIEKTNIENAAAIHVTSETEADELRKFPFRLRRVVNIPNGVDIPEEGLKDNISPAVKELIGKKPYLLFIGRINWKKGLDRLIPALNHVPDVHLVIAGNDEENHLPTMETLAKTHGVRNRITFTGPVYGNEKVFLLKHASVFVLPSYSENFGNTVLEAMAAGCPVVVTPEVGVADIIKEHGAGMVNEGSPDILGNQLRNLLSDPEHLKEMGRRGMKAVVEGFTWDIVEKQMEKAYEEILLCRGNND